MAEMARQAGSGVRQADVRQEARQAAPGAALAFAITCLAYFVPNYAQYQVSPFGSQVMSWLAITPGQFSLLFSAPMIPAIFLSLVAGLLIDRIGPKRVVGFALVCTTAGCLIRVLAQSYGLLLFGTALTGLTACFLSSGASKILAGYYGADGVESKMGVLMAMATIGMTVALATSTALGTITVAFWVSFALAALATVLWLALLKDPAPVDGTPADDASDVASNAAGAADSAAKPPSVAQCLRVVLGSRDVWLVSLGIAFVIAGNVVVGSMAPTALGTKGIDESMSGIITSLYTLGCLAGCFTSPALVKAFHGRQKPVLAIYGILAAVGVASSWTFANPVAVAVCMFLTGNFMGGMIPLFYAIPVQLADIGPTYAGTAGGILVTVQSLAAVILPSFVFGAIAGSNMTLMFILAGLSVAAGCVLSLIARVR